MHLVLQKPTALESITQTGSFVSNQVMKISPIYILVRNISKDFFNYSFTQPVRMYLMQNVSCCVLEKPDLVLLMQFKLYVKRAQYSASQYGAPKYVG